MDTFEAWMKEVDRVLVQRIGFTHEDCRDRCWYDMYDDELSPEEAVSCEFGDNLDDVEGMMFEELFG